MLLSVNWLREFVPYEGTLDALCDRLTMIGMEVEEVQYPFAGLNDVVVGHVVACDKHPQADTLSVCKVDMGDGEPVQIVCGAPNVAAGQKVAVAPVGATLPNGMKLKKVKLRGEVSMGMICAEDELGLGDDHSGIMVLDPEFRVGTPPHRGPATGRCRTGCGRHAQQVRLLQHPRPGPGSGHSLQLARQPPGL